MQLRSVSGMNIPQGHRPAARCTPLPITRGFEGDPRNTASSRHYHNNNNPNDIQTIPLASRSSLISTPLRTAVSFIDSPPRRPRHMPASATTRYAHTRAALCAFTELRDHDASLLIKTLNAPSTGVYLYSASSVRWDRCCSCYGLLSETGLPCWNSSILDRRRPTTATLYKSAACALLVTIAVARCKCTIADLRFCLRQCLLPSPS